MRGVVSPAPEAGSSTGNAFPSTSWVADRPRPLNLIRLELGGLVAHPLRLPVEDLRAGDRLVATLDCTGGFYARILERRGPRTPLDRAGPLPGASHVRVISHTGYRWSFELQDAFGLLLATDVEGQALSRARRAGPAGRARPARVRVGQVGGLR